MTDFISIHPENPQPRLIKQVVESLSKGEVIAYPTDSGYALGCHIGDKKALDKIRKIRKLDDAHNFTLMCENLSDLSLYAKVDNTAFRLLKKHIPGPYTFIFEATREVPKRLQHPKRKTVGLRVPKHAIVNALLTTLGEPMMSVSLIFPDEDNLPTDAWDIYEYLKGKVAYVIDGGSCTTVPTTVVNFSTNIPEVARYGQGDASAFE